ncbi:MAG: hypothetical protein COU67_03045 [Candidatus Pacebacteria bacterium CG10_big_fil_rev_8_21_14_0_10_44_54]|nr:MAG: hypothetical protein COU67_03045 [Candidatus Pacebacteria bacterium CG10_big_fil_rev_8_21_14_0_10_44_54]
MATKDGTEACSRIRQTNSRTRLPTWEFFCKKRERKEGMLMQNIPAAMPYSKEALEALSQVLATHQSLIWVDPSTNQLGVKQIVEDEVAEQIAED